MKLNLRDLFWLILTLGIGLAWYAYAYANQTEEVAVREGEIIAILSVVKGLPEEHTTTLGIVSAVSRDRLQFDASISPGLPDGGVAINERGQCLGITYSEKGNGVSYVRRLHTFPLDKIKKKLQEANR